MTRSRQARSATPRGRCCSENPAGGALVYGCLIEVDGVDELRDGTTVTASFTFWQPLTPEPPGPIPVWYGHVIGEASELRRVEDGLT